MMSDKENIPQGFTMKMALTDILPVLFFSIGAGVLAERVHHPVFAAGIVLIIAAGSLKVLWKVVLALARRDAVLLNRQMRFVMPAGFLLAVIGLFLGRDQWSWSAVWNHVMSFPSVLFFVLGLIGIGFMAYYAGHLNGRDARSNWIEQGTNALAQLCFLLGILL